MSMDTAEQSRAVLLAARELDEAVAESADDIPTRQRQLLNAALAREAGGVVAGFEAVDVSTDGRSADEISDDQLEDELSAALVELEIGNVLVAGSAVTNADERAVSSALADAVDNLQAARKVATPEPLPTVRPLFGGSDTKPDDFFTLLPQSVSEVVDRTVVVVSGAFAGLGRIPAAHLQPVLTGVASAIPDVGGLIQAGLRAVRRAVDKLARLVPEAMRSKVVGWAAEWWKGHRTEVMSGAVRTALSVDDLDRQIAARVARARADAKPSDDQLRRGAEQLTALAERHARLTKVVDRIVNALSRAIGPLVAAFPPVAVWIYVSGGSGLLAAAGVAVWASRDYLDSSVPFARVEGVRAIMASALGG